jgi:hypothetical protein
MKLKSAAGASGDDRDQPSILVISKNADAVPPGRTEMNALTAPRRQLPAPGRRGAQDLRRPVNRREQRIGPVRADVQAKIGQVRHSAIEIACRQCCWPNRSLA